MNNKKPHYRLLVRNLREGKHRQFQSLLIKNIDLSKKIDLSQFYTPKEKINFNPL
ncbi:MAG: hypothetical protein GY739_19380 [Mesoflavibacter sp.]|nr:hypothetical protein [Mesoflavibacter sp.]